MVLVSCAMTIIINLTSQWTDDDIAALRRAKVACKEKYHDAPCLKRFTKKKTRTYQALCGEEKY